MSDQPTTTTDNTPVNEFDQPVEGVSLTRDAWRRLKKKVVIVYALLSITAPILPIHSFRHQVSEHRDLPPSFTKTAGELWYERVETRMYALAERAGQTTLSEEDQAELAEIRERISTERREIGGEDVLVHQRRYVLGTDHLGRDLLARIIYGGQISIAISSSASSSERSPGTSAARRITSSCASST